MKNKKKDITIPSFAWCGINGVIDALSMLFDKSIEIRGCTVLPGKGGLYDIQEFGLSFHFVCTGDKTGHSGKASLEVQQFRGQPWKFASAEQVLCVDQNTYLIEVDRSDLKTVTGVSKVSKNTTNPKEGGRDE